MTNQPTQQHSPCRDCQHHNLDADACINRPQCRTHRGRRHLDQWGMCDECQTTVITQLRALPELVALAPQHLQPTVTGDHHATGVPGSRPPLDIAALDLACAEWLLMTDQDTDDPPWTGLEDWEHDWRKYLHDSSYGEATAHRAALGQSTLVGVVDYLTRNLDRAATIHPTIDKFAQDIRRMHTAALNALSLTHFDVDPDPGAEEPPDYVIPCPADVTDNHGNVRLCGHRIHMHRRPLPMTEAEQAHPTPITANCERCGTHWDTRRLIDVALAAGVPVEMSLAQVMDHYSCSERTIRRKVALGVLLHNRGRYQLTRHADTG